MDVGLRCSLYIRLALVSLYLMKNRHTVCMCYIDWRKQGYDSATVLTGFITYFIVDVGRLSMLSYFWYLPKLYYCHGWKYYIHVGMLRDWFKIVIIFLGNTVFIISIQWHMFIISLNLYVLFRWSGLNLCFDVVYFAVI